MADVQLEHGFLRIANALFEAIILAPFTVTQMKIVHWMIRQTYGWNRLVVQASMPEMAEHCGLSFTGGFRRGLQQLIDEGVVRVTKHSKGKAAAEYMINKDFENWGRLSVPGKLLERLYRYPLPPQIMTNKSDIGRPTWVDGTQEFVYYARTRDLVKIGFSKDPWARVQAMRTARPDIMLIAVEFGDRGRESQRHEQFNAKRLGDKREWFTWDEVIAGHVQSLPTVDKLQPPAGHPSIEEDGGDDMPGTAPPGWAQPHEAVKSQANSAPEDELEATKDLFKRHDFTPTPTTARAKLDVVKLVVAANLGLAEHDDPSRRQAIPLIFPTQGSALEAAEKLEAAGVPQEFAEAAIYQRAKTHRGDGPIKSLLYFVAATIRALEEKQQAEAMASAPRPASLPAPDRRPSPSARAASDAHVRRSETERALLDREYQQHRKGSFDLWAKLNEEEFQALQAKAIAESGLEPEMVRFAKVAIDNAMHLEWAQKHDFPAFDAWLESRAVPS